eukprot:CAMPEP_0172589656 /NCGR_PEP_ID=MMETSP1068-20121228/8296_1 /TAXON_ID=35684 /ORGANISM="Pseudopedinella elastica, Strain CCMP716" /LENGTH=978 /DNA_ID=CAMNT_0013385291 /DNA_START=219 /DNA_END=3155 /DNA_ORIENTATION=-
MTPFDLKIVWFIAALSLRAAFGNAPEHSLALTAQCTVGGVEVPCSAAQWSGGGPKERKASGHAVGLSLEESCSFERPTESSAAGPPRCPRTNLVAVAARGACSFATKALAAQLLGYRGLLIVDTTSPNLAPGNLPPAPGLGPEGVEVHIPVVMVPRQTPGRLDSLTGRPGVAGGGRGGKGFSPAWSPPCAATTPRPFEQIGGGGGGSDRPVPVSVELSSPDAASLWLSSPWYASANGAGKLSAAGPGAAKFSVRCDRLSEVTDDPWLFEEWLKELRGQNQTCREVGSIEPQVTAGRGHLTQESVGERGQTRGQGVASADLAHLLTLMDKWDQSFGLARLPHWDARGEHMQDMDLLHRGYDQQACQQEAGGRGNSTHPDATPMPPLPPSPPLSSPPVEEMLAGLNSNSHRFPWGGRNLYPRFFESGVLVVRRGSVAKDGAVLAHRPLRPRGAPSNISSASSAPAPARDASAEEALAEFHYGGCGCCPLGHGELGRTFVVADKAVADKAVAASGSNGDTGDSDQGTDQGGCGLTSLSGGRHFGKLVSLVQRFHHVYYHQLLEALPRLLQVLELVLADREWKVLVDTSGGPIVEDFLVNFLGLEPAQIVPYRGLYRRLGRRETAEKDGPDVIAAAAKSGLGGGGGDHQVVVDEGAAGCRGSRPIAGDYSADLLLVPAPLPCGHAPKALTRALRERLAAALARLDDEQSQPQLQERLKEAEEEDGEEDGEEEETKGGSEMICEAPRRGLPGVSVSSRVANPPNTTVPQRLMLVLKRLGTRSVANHAEVVAALKHEFERRDCESVERESKGQNNSQGEVKINCESGKRGGGVWEVREVETSGLTAAEQAGTFRAAAVVVAPHGSGLSNAIFMGIGRETPPLQELGRHRASKEKGRGDGAGGRGREALEYQEPAARAVVVELLPWEYPNLTFYVAMAWLRDLGVKHALFLVPGGNAYRAMQVDAKSLARRLRRYLRQERELAGG